MGRLDGKIALVSGGARGMGASHAQAMIGEGARVVVGDLLDDEGAALVNKLGDDAAFVHLDVTDEASWDGALRATIDAFGPPNVLVNNAGIVLVGLITTMTKAEFERVLAVDLVGVWLGMHTVAPAMIGAGGGSIVNVSSTAGLFGYPGVSGYVAAKWGVRGVTKSAALELGRQGIRVNSIHPGAVDTPMVAGAPVDESTWSGQPIARIATPADISPLVVYLASDESSYCTGQEFVVDGGHTCGPSLPPGF